ncbi:MAG TPA: nucleoside-diphosphate kinase [Patescibacteria group bacterium]|nr:nucleoside-diphosphate kinase [Patescibacteria group bacterium]
MMSERTLAIIKPDAVAKGAAGQIFARIEKAGFTVIAARMIRMTEEDAAGFYAVHRARPFFKSLCTFMTQGPCIPMVLEADNAIQRWRDLMGATDPAKAAAGTIRKDFAESIEANAVHGSDAPQTAAFEIPYFFSSLDLCPR